MEGKGECIWNPNIFPGNGQQDIKDIVSHNFLKIIKANLTDDTCQIVMIREDEPEAENWCCQKLSEWFAAFADSGYVDTEDRKNYLSFCNLDHMRRRFRTGSKFMSCHYRRKRKDEFRWVSMEVITAQEYRNDHQVVFLYVRDIHDDYLHQLDFTVRRMKNTLSIVNLDLTGNLYESGYGDYASLVLDEADRTADDYLGFLGGFVQGKKTKLEFQKTINRENLLRSFSEGKTRVFYTGAFLLEQEKMRTLRFTVTMEQNSFSGDVEAILYTTDVTEEYLKSHFIPMLFHSNFLTIGVIDIRHETIALMKGALQDVSQLIDSEMPYEAVRQKTCMENIAPIDREAYLERTTLENLKRNLSGNDYYSFPIYYEKDGKRGIRNYQYSYLSEEFGMVIVTVEDVTILSEKDALTGGANQQGFIRRVEAFLEKQKQQGAYAILCLDVKGFKAINELFGIIEGNDLLRKLYWDLEKSFLEPLLTARVDADQYLCLIKWSMLDYDKLVSWCETDYFIKGRPFRVSKRCGIYRIHDNTIAVRSMCDRARLAMSIAKSERSTKSYVIFDDTMSEEYIDRSEILGQFDNCLKNREFCVYLQPVVDPVTGQISSAEALTRWNHSKKGFISPHYFIPALEGNGYISQLDLYIAREVEKFQQEREDKGLLVVPISINLSWLDFYDEELLKWLQGYVESRKGKKHTIRFEITESSYTAVAENRGLLFKRIRDNGGELMLDDFGSGYSSFSTLQNYDFDILKIDIGFVKKIEQSEKTKSIVDSIIKMVHQMDARVVAEGAETQKQVEFLKERGCDYIQGYYFYKPMSMEMFASVLDSREI